MSDIDVEKWLKKGEYLSLKYGGMSKNWAGKIARLRRQNEKLREGLEFYAEGENFQETWEWDGSDETKKVFLDDKGQKAREILEEIDNG